MVLMTSREIMKTIYGIKGSHNLKHVALVLVFLGSVSIFLSVANAESVQYLQQRASFAYDMMIQAQKNAETSTRKMTAAEKNLAIAKQKFTEAKEIAETAREESKQANAAMHQATTTWKNASEALAIEWEKSGKR